jgi:hypothetical protein
VCLGLFPGCLRILHGRCGGFGAWLGLESFLLSGREVRVWRKVVLEDCLEACRWKGIYCTAFSFTRRVLRRRAEFSEWN